MNGNHISFSGLRLNWQIPTELTWYPSTAIYRMRLFFPAQKIRRFAIQDGFDETKGFSL